MSTTNLDGIRIIQENNQGYEQSSGGVSVRLFASLDAAKAVITDWKIRGGTIFGQHPNNAPTTLQYLYITVGDDNTDPRRIQLD